MGKDTMGERTDPAAKTRREGRSEFDLFDGIRIGRYSEVHAPLHALDARVKLLLGVMLIAGTVASQGIGSQLLILGAVTAGFPAARVRPSEGFRPLIPVLPFVFVLALLQLFAVPQLRTDTRVLWEWGLLKISTRGLAAGVLLVTRFTAIVAGMSLLSAVTTASDLASGIEHLLRPLQKMGVPAHEFSLALGISIRFVPVLTEEAARLMKAQASRGADFGYHKTNFVKKMRTMLPLLVPLFLTSLRRAQNLVEAMESRCYTGGKGRTYMRRPKARPADLCALACAACVVGGAVVLSVFGADARIWRLLGKVL